MLTPGQNKFKIAVLGPGAVGGFLTALFSKNGNSVTCIAKEEAVRIISQEGLKLESGAFGKFTSWPKAVSQMEEEPDLLFITTKAVGLSEALKRIDPSFIKNTVVIPFLNGIEHMELLRKAFGKRVLAASIGNVELKRISVNHILHSAPSATVELAHSRDISEQLLNEITQLFSGVGIKIMLATNEKEVLWRKLVRLNAVACTTSAIDQPIGFIRSDKEWRLILENCITEAAQVALAEGVDIEPRLVMEQINGLPHNLGTSLQRDINAGKVSELDAIAGAIVRAGYRHKIACPTIDDLINKINLRQQKITCRN